MKKKQLLKMPHMRATAAMMEMAKQEKPLVEKRWGSTYTTYKKRIYMRCMVREEILKVSLYWSEYMRTGAREPLFELYISRTEERFITYDCINQRWLNAKLNMLTWPSYIYGTEWISGYGFKTIKEYLGGGHGGYRGLLDFQLKVRKDEWKRRCRKETDPWDQDMRQTPDLPKDWVQWVTKVGISENYIFYHYNKKGVEKGYCTYCEKDVPIHHPRHNKEGRCPCCRHKITYKAALKVGNLLTNNTPMYLLQRCEDGVMIREFYGHRKYPKGEYHLPELYWVEVKRVIYDQRMNLRAYIWENYRQQEMRWVGGHPCNPGWRSGRLAGKIYGKTLPDLSKRELSRTGILEMYHGVGALDPELYLAVLRVEPRLEQIIKGGLTKMAADCLANPYNIAGMLHTRTSLSGMLGINNQILKRLRKVNGGIRFLEWIQAEQAQGKSYPDRVISWLCEEEIKPDDIKFIWDRMGVVQIYNYIRRQKEQSNMDSRQVLSTWKDYLSMAKRVGLDTNDEIVYRVSKLVLRHNQLVARCNNRKDLALRAGEILKSYPHVEEICKTLQEKYGYADEDYTIIAPDHIEDILQEGEALSHCIASSDSYWERIERKETYILFLRKTADVTTPYYTLEIEPDATVRQKRTMFDRQNADIEDAVKFLRKWQKVVAARLTKEDRVLAKKSVVLRKQELIELREDNVVIHIGDLHGRLLADVLMDDLLENKEAA